MRAYVRLRERPMLPTVLAGLAAAGYETIEGDPRTIVPGDVLVTWNRSAREEPIAQRVEAEGGTVLVMENGYFGETEQRLGFRHYALARGEHNGAGEWEVGEGSRLEAFGIQLKPWRDGGKYVLVCPSRGIGSTKMRMPPDWLQSTLAKLKAISKLPVLVRGHPGNWRRKGMGRWLLDDLQKAAAVVIWASSVGVQALMEGVPVIYTAPRWIAEGACTNDLERVNRPHFGTRLPVFERLMWAHWTKQELESGYPFRLICRREERAAA